MNLAPWRPTKAVGLWFLGILYILDASHHLGVGSYISAVRVCLDIVRFPRYCLNA